MINSIKKREIAILFLILIIPSTCAIIGVRPASYETNFEPNAKKVFSFNFVGDEGVNFEMYSDGPFSEYVELSANKLKGGESINVLLQFPAVAEIPGRHRLLIGGRQVANEESGMLGIVGNVQAVIFVNVPYPGKYAELDFSVTNANTGGDVDFNLKIYSKGEEDINTVSKIEIYDSQRKNLIETIDLGARLVKSTEFVELKSKLSTAGYGSGDYIAKAVVQYETGKAESEKIFRLGKLFVDVINSTSFVDRDKINRFEIQVESYWNDPIQGLYANVSIINYSNLEFLTPSIVIDPWQKSTLVGYFDTSEVKQNKFKAKIILNYQDETTEKIVDVEFIKESNYTLYVVVGIIAVLIIGALIAIVIIKRKNKKEIKNGKKK